MKTLEQNHHVEGLAIKSPDSRIIGYDFARALAFFGMVVVNFKIVMTWGAINAGSDWFVWSVGLLEGRAAATFVILAGVGLSLLSRRARLANDKVGIAKNRNTLLKRALFLFVAGLLFVLIWPGDILHFYGVYIAIGALLLTVSERRLWILAFIFMAVFVVLMLTFDYYQDWNWATFTYTGFWTPSGMIRNLFFNGFHPVFPWVFFILVGMWLGRQDLSNSTLRKRILLVAVGVVCLAELASWLLTHNFPINIHGIDSEALFGTGPLPPMPLYLLSGGGTALVVITLSNMLTERFATTRWLEPIVATGQMALTLYIAHVIIGIYFLEAIGLLGHQPLSIAVGSAAVFCVGAVFFSFFLRKQFKRGPLEWVMRRVTR